jgi:hypothetical protein
MLQPLLHFVNFTHECLFTELGIDGIVQQLIFEDIFDYVDHCGCLSCALVSVESDGNVCFYFEGDDANCYENVKTQNKLRVVKDVVSPIA